MKKIVLFALSIFLTSCGNPKTVKISGNYSLPKELNNCSIHYLSDGNLTNFIVVRCPNSSTTTTKLGKYQQTIAVVEIDTTQQLIDSLEKKLVELKKNRKE